MPLPAGRRGLCGDCSPSLGNATDIVYSDDPFVIVNMSVWESIEALREFAYKSQHIQVLRERAK